MAKRPGLPRRRTLRSNHTARARNQVDLPQLESAYRGTGGQLVAPRAGSQTVPAPSSYLMCYPSEQFYFPFLFAFIWFVLAFLEFIFTTRDVVK